MLRRRAAEQDSDPDRRAHAADPSTVSRRPLGRQPGHQRRLDVSAGQHHADRPLRCAGSAGDAAARRPGPAAPDGSTSTFSVHQDAAGTPPRSPRRRPGPRRAARRARSRTAARPRRTAAARRRASAPGATGTRRPAARLRAERVAADRLHAVHLDGAAGGGQARAGHAAATADRYHQRVQRRARALGLLDQLQARACPARRRRPGGRTRRSTAWPVSSLSRRRPPTRSSTRGAGEDHPRARRPARSTFVGAASTGSTTVAASPCRRAASATATAWLPVLCAITPVCAGRGEPAHRAQRAPHLVRAAGLEVLRLEQHPGAGQPVDHRGAQHGGTDHPAGRASGRPPRHRPGSRRDRGRRGAAARQRSASPPSAVGAVRRLRPSARAGRAGPGRRPGARMRAEPADRAAGAGAAAPAPACGSRRSPSVRRPSRASAAGQAGRASRAAAVSPNATASAETSRYTPGHLCAPASAMAASPIAYARRCRQAAAAGARRPPREVRPQVHRRPGRTPGSGRRRPVARGVQQPGGRHRGQRARGGQQHRRGTRRSRLGDHEVERQRVQVPQVRRRHGELLQQAQADTRHTTGGIQR